MGRCPGCGEWNTFVEERVEKGEERRREAGVSAPRLLKLPEIRSEEGARLPTGFEEVDRVLGGGIVPGALILLGGDPGVGKSTLVLEIAAHLAQRGLSVLYVTGEESPQQVRLRAERLGLVDREVWVVAEGDLMAILDAARKIRPHLVIVDSIQTIWHPDLSSAPGSVSQVRECGGEFLRFAKSEDTAVLLIGHVTKEGAIAGPRTLEHMVDVVLYLEGERGHDLRILRATKNRFGSASEIGVFEMGERGLLPVENPSGLFISRERKGRVGVAVVPLLEGRRPLLVELQALVARTPFAVPQRVSAGFDPKRLSMLLAVAEKEAGAFVRNQDVYVNVTGGLRITESGADLGLLMAILSSHLGRPLPGDRVFLGEVGLAGEIRPVKGTLLRLKEALRMGFQGAYVAAEGVPKDPSLEGFVLEPLKTVKEAVERCFG